MYLTQSLHKTARENPTRAATIYAERTTMFSQLIDRVARLASALRSHGVSTGDRVGMLAMNSDRYIQYVYGTLWAGAVINPVNIRWSTAEIAYSINDCQTDVLLVDDAFASVVGDLRERCPGLRTVIHCGDAETPSGMLDYEALIRTSEPIADAIRCGDDLAAVLYTGGTTGAPKGVMLSHTNIASNVLSALAATSRPDVATVLQIAPFFHIGALSFVFQSMARLATQVILPGFDAKAVIRDIARYRANEIFIVPTMLKMMLDEPSFAEHDLSSLKSIIYGASPIDSSLLQRAIVAIPSSQFLQAYGMTETSPVSAVLPAACHVVGDPKLKAAGRPAPACEVRIVDPVTGEECPPGSVGEVTVRGPGVMLGYWNKPEETAKALRNGWMHTGDAGYMDADGYLYMTDRIKDMIISGGENIYSTEVENAILSHSAVQMCAVIGIPDEKWGEIVHAAVVLRPGQALTAEDLQTHCKQRIAGYKCPRSIEFRSELPLSAAGKLLKFKLRETYWQSRDRQI
ncbi:long-chain-fatty-acid--CoA ligase [Ralstonia insidiosa]|uniref:long-chain-fatty-acid--CoA ligase n=1 Tax=Ralstonia insidiosa TaxID=190721 RepID=UPI000CEEA36A|nr:long-chain-fatty-acid--CoA ligase [Ralstonia insidiosa]